jgi:hypothetical protein
MMVNEINRIMNFLRVDRGFILASAKPPSISVVCKKSLEKMIAEGTLPYFEEFRDRICTLGRKLWRKIKN